MNTQPNNPSDFNSLSELYMKACEARFQLLQERSELVMENFELRMQLQELRAQVSPSKADQKPKGSAGKGGAPAAYRATEDRHRI